MANTPGCKAVVNKNGLVEIIIPTITCTSFRDRSTGQSKYFFTNSLITMKPRIRAKKIAKLIHSLGKGVYRGKFIVGILHL